MLVSEDPIVVEISVGASIDSIWSGLTEPDQMRQWFFDAIPDFKAEPGFETGFEVSNDGRDFPHVWKVVEVIKNEKLVINWTYGGYEGSANVQFDVVAGDDANTIRLTANAVEDFDQEIPEFRRESAVDGWDYLINGQLKNFLAG